MTLEKLSDEQVQEIQRLSDEGYTHRAIAEKVAVSLGTVSKYTRGKRRATFGYSEAVIENLCERLAPILLEKLKAGTSEESPDNKENKDKKEEEEKMSNGDVESKAQEIADRREMLKRMEKMEQWGKDMEVLKSQVGKVPEQVINEIGELKAGMEGIKKDTKDTRDLCTKFPEFCATQEKIQKQIDKIESDAHSPKGIGFAGHQTEHPTMEEFFTCCNSDDKESCSTNELAKRIPVSLKAKLLRLFCTDEACLKELDKQGFEATYKEKYKGFLGG